MKKKIAIFLFICCKAIAGYAQPQSTSSNATSYSQFTQIDSSEIFLYGELLNKTAKPKYNLDRMYSAGGTFWTNLFIYNSATKKTVKVFQQNLILVYPFYAGFSYNNNYEMGNFNNITFSAIAKDVLVVMVRTDDNGDGIIDEDDPIGLYLISKNGTAPVQVSPKGMNAVSWKMAKDGRMIIAKLQKDTNGDKKFTDEDEVIYQIDLYKDISKIVITPVI